MAVSAISTEQTGYGGLLAIGQPRLVGRDTTLRRLTRALAAPRSAVIIEGEAGIGKSRIVRELMDRCLEPEHRLICGCPPLGRPFTLGSIVDALRARGAPGPELASRLSPLAGALRPLLPDWAQQLPPEPDPVDDPDAARHRLFAAVVEMLACRGIRSLVVEDAHWADPATVELLLLLAGAGPPDLRLVITYRREDIPEDSALLGLSRFATGQDGDHVALGPLDRSQTRELAASMLGGPPVSDELASLLHGRTEGLPLAIEESVRAMAESGALSDAAGSWRCPDPAQLEVPTAVSDVVLDRLRRLSCSAVGVLRAAAVVAAPTAERIVAEVAGLSPGQAQRGIEEALTCRLLEEHEPGVVAFRHSLAGLAVLGSMDEATRARLHRRAGRALERGAAVSPARIAGHFRDGGDLSSWRRHAERAADLAAAAGDAAGHDSLLLDLIEDPALPPGELARLIGRLRFALSDGRADYPRLVDALRRALADPALPRSQRAELRVRLGNVSMLVYDYSGALLELETAVPDLDHDPELKARAMTLLGCPFGSDRPVQVHLGWLRAAESVPQSDESRSELAGLRALAMLMLGQPAGWRDVDRLPSDCSIPHQRLRIARNNLNIGHASIAWGRYQEADRRLRVSLDTAERYGYPRTVDAVRVVLTHLDLLRGRWDGLAEVAAELAGDRDIAPGAAAEARLVVARLELAGGCCERGIATLSQLAEVARDQGQEDLWVEATATIAVALLDAAEPSGATAALTGPVTSLTARDSWLWLAGLAPAWVRCLVASGRTDEAADFTERFHGVGQELPAPTVQAAASTCRAEVDAVRGGPETAARSFAAAAERWLRLPRPYDAQLCRARAAEALLRSGASEAGLAQLADAAHALWSLGATAAADRFARVVREHGVRLRRPGAGRPSYGERLSPREHEVATLVAAGRTDREIAEQLFLSPRTVASHVASARRKLAAASRAALAARLVDGTPSDPRSTRADSRSNRADSRSNQADSRSRWADSRSNREPDWPNGK